MHACTALPVQVSTKASGRSFIGDILTWIPATAISHNTYCYSILISWKVRCPVYECNCADSRISNTPSYGQGYAHMARGQRRLGAKNMIPCGETATSKQVSIMPTTWLLGINRADMAGAYVNAANTVPASASAYAKAGCSYLGTYWCSSSSSSLLTCLLNWFAYARFPLQCHAAVSPSFGMSWGAFPSFR